MTRNEQIHNAEKTIAEDRRAIERAEMKRVEQQKVASDARVAVVTLKRSLRQSLRAS